MGDKDRDPRQLVVDELISTELDYVRNLQSCIEFYKKPLEKEHHKWGVTLEQINSMFSNIGAITKLHQDISRKLLGEDPEGIFSEFAEALKIYIIYINNFNFYEETYCELEKHTRFQRFLSTERRNTSHPLESYLIMPVQRIPRYVLLLRDLLKRTPNSHPRYGTLQRSLASVKELAQLINEAKRREETNQAVEKNDVIKVIQLSNPSRGGSIRQGEVVMHTEKVQAVLFRDLLLVTSLNGQELRHTYDLHEFHITEETTKKGLGVELKRIVNDFHEEVTFVCRDEDTAEDWIDDIAACSESLKDTPKREFLPLLNMSRTQRFRVGSDAYMDPEHDSSPSLGVGDPSNIKPHKRDKRRKSRSKHRERRLSNFEPPTFVRQRSKSLPLTAFDFLDGMKDTNQIVQEQLEQIRESDEKLVELEKRASLELIRARTHAGKPPKISLPPIAPLKQLCKSKKKRQKKDIFRSIKIEVISAVVNRADTFGLADPYVKIRIGKAVQKTNIISNTLTPQWDRSMNSLFVYKKVKKRGKLKIEVWDEDVAMKDDFLGKIDVRLSDLCMSPSKPETIILVDQDGQEILPKQTLTFFAWVPHRNDIEIHLIEGVVKKSDRFGKCDPYVKVSTGKLNQQSATMPETQNPKWDQKLSFLEVESRQVIKFEVWDKDKRTRDDFLGQFEVLMCELDQDKPITMNLLNKKGKETQPAQSITFEVHVDEGEIMSPVILRPESAFELDLDLKDDEGFSDADFMSDQEIDVLEDVTKRPNLGKTNERWYWLQHNELIWVPAKLTEQKDGVCYFETLDSMTLSHHSQELEQLDEADEFTVKQSVSNLVDLEQLTEGSIMHQLRTRYFEDKIYTFMGAILVSINPYKKLPLFGEKVMDKYISTDNLMAIAPHAYNTAARLYRGLISNGFDQSVVISGESGAGKTEMTKFILEFLARAANPNTLDSSAKDMKDMLRKCSPLLEAFGNAKTDRNDNSSRFGKWVEILFDNRQSISHARIENYLLEKSRVVRQGDGERNFHIFYQLCDGATHIMDLKLKPPESFAYLNQSRCMRIPGVDDSRNLEDTRESLQGLGFDEETMFALFRIVSAVLHLGNINFEKKEDHVGRVSAKVINEELLNTAAELLEVSPDALRICLVFRSVTVRGSTSFIPLGVDEATDTRDALAKALYSNMFDWLVSHINLALSPSQEGNEMGMVGILDIFGFEIFEQNFFEQFCINYANEKLQQYFIQHMFKYEQEEYKREGIDVEHVDFPDNRDCIDLIDRKSLGILSMIDEQVIMPRGNDDALIESMHNRFTNSQYRCYKRIRQHPSVFVIVHYAGEVAYSIDGMVEKNKDVLQDQVKMLMQESENELIRELFPADEAKAALLSPRMARAHKKSGERHNRAKSMDHSQGQTFSPQADVLSPSPKTGGSLNTPRSRSRSPMGARRKRPRTLGSEFKSQLETLMTTLQSTEPHFVRCIKPNNLRKFHAFNSQLVLDQIKYSGLMESIRIRKAGYPHRYTHKQFSFRYPMCFTKITDDLTPRELCVKQIQSHHSPEIQNIQVGKTKVFIRSHQFTVLEQERMQSVTKRAIRIQRLVRSFLARRMIRKKKCAKRLTRAIKSSSIHKLERSIQYYDEIRIKDRNLAQLFSQAVKLLEYLRKKCTLDSVLEEARASYDIQQIDNAVLEYQHSALKDGDLTAASNSLIALREALAGLQESLQILEKESFEECSKKVPEIQASITKAEQQKLPEEYIQKVRELLREHVEEQIQTDHAKQVQKPPLLHRHSVIMEKFCRQCGTGREFREEHPGNFCKHCGYKFKESVEDAEEKIAILESRKDTLQNEIDAASTRQEFERCIELDEQIAKVKQQLSELGVPQESKEEQKEMEEAHGNLAELKELLSISQQLELIKLVQNLVQSLNKSDKDAAQQGTSDLKHILSG